MTPSIQAVYGLKWNPFSTEVPVEAIHPSQKVEDFAWRVQHGVGKEGGFALLTGSPGLGKSAALRVLAGRLDQVHELSVGIIEHPQSTLGDFYTELGACFGLALQPRSRWLGFRALRQQWVRHIERTLMRPILLIDEAQEVSLPVLNELRILSSTCFDSKIILGVVFCGDERFLERLSTQDLLPLGSRIRTRLVLEPASEEELKACLMHRMAEAGNSALMTSALIKTLCEHSLGNMRILLQMAGDLLAVAAKKERDVLDEKLYFEVFAPPKKAGVRRRKTS